MLVFLDDHVRWWEIWGVQSVVQVQHAADVAIETLVMGHNSHDINLCHIFSGAI